MYNAVFLHCLRAEGLSLLEGMGPRLGTLRMQAKLSDQDRSKIELLIYSLSAVRAGVSPSLWGTNTKISRAWTVPLECQRYKIEALICVTGTNCQLVSVDFSGPTLGYSARLRKIFVRLAVLQIVIRGGEYFVRSCHLDHDIMWRSETSGLAYRVQSNDARRRML